MKVALYAAIACGFLLVLAAGAFGYAVHTSSGHGMANLVWLGYSTVLMALAAIAALVAVVFFIAGIFV